MTRRKGLLAILFSLLGGLCLHAQVETWVAKEYTNFTGGLNDTADVTVLKDTEASDLQNIVFSTSGALVKRGGWTKESNTATCGGQAVTGVTFYKQADGDRFLVAVCANDTIQKMDYTASGPDGTWDAITGALSFSIGANDLSDFAIAEDDVVIEDGLNTTAPYVWTGSGNAAALGGSPPNATLVEFHKRHLFLAGRTDARSRVDFSALDNIGSWTTGTDFVLVETDDGQVITGLKSGLDCLYIFKSESIWRLCGTNKDDFTLEQMVRGVGAASNASIQLINNQFVFFGNHGDFIVYDGGIRVELLSTKIEGTLDGLEAPRFDKTVSVAFDGGQTGDEDYYACLTSSGGTTHNRVLLFDTLHKAWTKFVGINCNAMTVGEVGAFEHALFFGDYNGFVNRHPDTNADDGQAIDAYYITGASAFGLPQQKHFRHAQVIVKQESTGHDLQFEPQVDFVATGTATAVDLAGSGATYDTAVYDSSTYADLNTTIANIELQRVGNYFGWKISNENASEPFTLRNVRIWHESTGRVE